MEQKGGKNYFSDQTLHGEYNGGRIKLYKNFSRQSDVFSIWLVNNDSYLVCLIELADKLYFAFNHSYLHNYFLLQLRIKVLKEVREKVIQIIQQCVIFVQFILCFSYYMVLSGHLANVDICWWS